MKLGVILAIGESLKDLEKKGQAVRMIKYNIKNYSRNFDKVYVFSYENEKNKLPKNCYLVPNKYRVPRIIYSLTMPFINYKYFKNCDVFRSFQLTGGIPAIIAKIFFGKKFIFNYGYNYSEFALIEGKYVRAIILKPLTFIISNFADNIIVTSKFLIQNLPQSASKKIHIIPNSVDTKIFKNKRKTKTSKIKELLFVGRLEKQKNLKNLILAVKGLKDVRLTVIGDGSQKSELKKTVKNLKVEVRFEGKVDYDKLPTYFQNADIFILPSVTEGHPKALLEAQSSGLVCIASNIEANREIIKNGVNGILCTTSPRSIQKAILQSIKSRSLSLKMANQARKTAVENFEVTKVIEKEIKLLKSMQSK